MNEINEKRKCLDFPGHHVNGFRAKNTNVKSFSSLRPLMATQVNDMNDKIELTEENGAFFEPAGLVKLPRRQKEMYVEKFERRDLYPQGKEMVPLFLGITIGILSTTVTIQREVEDLNDLLEQAENMVKDLHNKLETKDGFTTKEHGTEADVTATASPKAKNLDLTSDIEAELEAELERLEENMKDCTLQRLHNVVEIDSDYEADMARGNLNLDALPWRSESLSESDHSDKHNESESTSKRIFTPNYAVSSLDLRLRLHEVIESELRARIEELEAVLKNQNSQSKPSSPKGPEPQEENSFWDFDHTRIESSSSTP